MSIITKKLYSLIKSYGHMSLPVLYAIFYVSTFTYLENRPVSYTHIIEMKIDRYIPFCEYFIIPYYLWFVYIAATVITFMFLDRKEYYQLCLTLGLGMTVFLFVSYVYPNGLNIRPTTFARDNLFVDLVKFLHKSDTSTNVLPSIHCYNSIVANAAIWKNRILGQNKLIRYGSLIFSTSVLLSTLFLKQHSFMDLLTAILMFIVFYAPIYMLPSLQSKKVHATS